MARKKKKSPFRWLIRLFLWPIGALFGLVLLCNLWIVLVTQDHIYASADQLENNEVALVLGTSKNIAPNQPNQHFVHRLEAAAKLYHAGKVRHILVSGDRDSIYYNEPRDMREKLISLGVPEEAITTDDAGFRTLDSVVRAKKIFGLDKFTVITDDFHVSRALFIARKEHLDVVAFVSEPVDYRMSFKTRVREYLARVKAVMDLYILRTEPEMLGHQERILVQNSPAEEEV